MVEITYNLFALKRQLEIKTGHPYTWRELGKLTGVHYNTLSNLANNKTARVDVDILARIIYVFRNAGMPITISDLFSVNYSDAAN